MDDIVARIKIQAVDQASQTLISVRDLLMSMDAKAVTLQAVFAGLTTETTDSAAAFELLGSATGETNKQLTSMSTRSNTTLGVFKKLTGEATGVEGALKGVGAASQGVVAANAKVTASNEATALSFIALQDAAKASFSEKFSAQAMGTVNTLQAGSLPPAGGTGLAQSVEAYRTMEQLDLVARQTMIDIQRFSDSGVTRNAAALQETQGRYNEVLAQAIEQERTEGSVRDQTVTALRREQDAMNTLAEASARVAALMQAQPSFSEARASATSTRTTAVEGYASAMMTGAPEGDVVASRKAAIAATVDAARYDMALADAEDHVRTAAEKAGVSVTGMGTAGEHAGKSFSSLAHYAWLVYNPLVLFPALMAKFALSTTVGFDQALHHVQAFTDVQARDIPKLKAELEGLAATYGLTLADLGQGIYDLESAGIKGSDAEIALSESAKAAAASGSQLTDVISATTSMVKAFNLHGDAIRQNLNDMAAGAKFGKLEFKDYAATIGNVIPIAAHLGVSMKDVGAAVAILTNQGNSPAEAIVLLRNLLISMDAPIAKQVTVLHALGLGVQDVDIKARGLAPVLETVSRAYKSHIPGLAELQSRTDLSAKATSTLSANLVSQEQVVRKVFGQNQVAMRAFFALFGDGGKQWDGMFQKMLNDQGTIGDAWKIQSSALETNLKLAREDIELIANDIGEKLIPALNAAAAAAKFLGGGGHAQGTVDTLSTAIEAAAVYYGGTKGVKVGGALLSKLPAATAAGEGGVAGAGALAGLEGAAGLAAGALAFLVTKINPWVAAATTLFILFQKSNEQADRQNKTVKELTDEYARHKIGLQELEKDFSKLDATWKTGVSAGRAGTVGGHPDWLVSAEKERDQRDAAEARKRAQQAEAGYQLGRRMQGQQPEMLGPPHAGTAADLVPDVKHVAIQFEHDQSVATEGLKRAEEAMAQRVLEGKGAVQAFNDQAVRDANIVKRHADTLADQVLIIARATGEWAQVMASEKAKDQKAFDDARAKLVLGLHDGASVKGQAEAAAKLQDGVLKWSDAEKKADLLIEEAAKRLAKTWDELTKRSQDLATKSLGALEFAMYHGKPTGKLLDQAAHDSRDLTHEKKTGTQAAYDIALKNGDYGTINSITSQGLQDANTTAHAKYVYDKDHGNTGGLGLDKKHIGETEAALKKFNREMEVGTGKLKESFADLQSTAQDKAKRALEDVSLASMKGSKNFESLFERAVRLEHGAEAFDLALQKMTLRVQERSSDPKTRLDAKTGIAQHDFDEALASDTLDIAAHGKASKAHQKDLEDTSKRLKHLQDASEKAALSIGTPSERADKDRALRESRYNDAAAVVAKQERERGSASAEAIATLRKAKQHLDQFDDSVQKASKLDHLPGFSERMSDAQTLASKREGKLASDIMSGVDVTGDQRRAIKSAQDAAFYTAAQAEAEKRINDALAKINPKLLTFAQNLDLANKAYSDAIDTIANLILTGQADDPAHAGSGGPIDPDTGKRLDYTKLDQATAKLVVADEKLYKATEAQTEAQRIAAVATGHWADVLAIDLKKIDDAWAAATAHIADTYLNGGTPSDKDRADLAGAATGQENKNLSQDKGQRDADAALLVAYRGAGDLSRAFDLLTQTSTNELDRAWKSLQEHFLTGDGNLADLVESWKRAKAEKDKETDAVIQAAHAVGDFKTELTTRKGKDQETYDQSVSAAVLEVNAGGHLSPDEIASIQRNKAVLDQWTQNEWDVNFAIADTATKAKMLSDRFSHLVSEQSNVLSAEGSVTQAKMSQLADEGQLQVLTLQGIASDIQSQTAIISAEAAVRNAGLNAQIESQRAYGSVIGAQYDIAAAQLSLQQATTDAERVKAQWDIRLGQEGLNIAREQLIATQRAGAWEQRLATDGLRQATDKASADRAAQAWQVRIQQLKIVLDQDAVSLAEDNLKLTMDMLVVQTDIASSLTGVEAYGQMVSGDLKLIRQDTMQQAADQLAYQQASQSSAMDAAQWNIRLQQDAQALAIDTANSQTSKLQSDLQLIQDQNQFAADQRQAQLDEQRATTQAVVDGNNAEALQVMVDWLERMYMQAKTALGAAGIKTPMTSTNNQLNGLSGDVAVTVRPR